MGLEQQAADRVAELLRLRGHEVQLTAALWELAAADERLAAGMLRVILDAAVGSNSASLPVPEHMRVDHQQRTERRRLLGSPRRLGRVDWRFHDSDAQLHVVVEVKLDSRLGANQVGRYLQDDRVRGARHGGVLMLTKDPVNPQELGVAVRDARWLGVARWHTVLAPLAALPEKLNLGPTPDTAAWKAILARAAQPGDLGSVLPGYPELQHARRGQNAQARNLELLRVAVDEAVPELRERITAGRNIAGAYALQRSGRGRRVDGGGEVSLRIGGKEGFIALKFILRGSQLPLLLTVACWPPQPPMGKSKDWDSALTRLRGKGWLLSESWIVSPNVELVAADTPPHLALADAVVAAAATAVDEPLLLPGYLARSVRVDVAKFDAVEAIFGAQRRGDRRP